MKKPHPQAPQLNTYVVLLRGINVGGRNKVPMAELKRSLERQGFSAVRTYIASGNVILDSEANADEVRTRMEEALPTDFPLVDGRIGILVLSPAQLKAVIDARPEGFGDEPETYHSDAIFLMGLEPVEVLPLFQPREGVDRIWPGPGVIYSQRLSSQRTRSRLNRIMGTPEYKLMTIRNWNTTTKLVHLVDAPPGE